METPPPHLYKFRKFDNNVLDSLWNGTVYYATPDKLNDPFDCQPRISIFKDSPHRLKSLCVSLLEIDEYDTKRAKKNFLIESDLIDLLGIDEIQYYKEFIISRLIENVFKNKGILSLSSKPDDETMWSHYADGHRGICIEYSTKDTRCKNLREVTYGDRNITINNSDFDIIEKFSKLQNEETSGTIRNILFFNKTECWGHEGEWRDIGSQGLQDCPFTEITGIYFGIRCSKNVVNSIINIFDKEKPLPKFYSMYENEKGKLESREIANNGIRSFAPYSFPNSDYVDIDSLL